MSLSTRDVAEILGTTTETVHKLVQRGRLRAHRSGKGSRLIFDTRSVYVEVRRRKEKLRLTG